ncbi:MAG: hypothetical protein FJW40_21155 [Acidobacteria bacterium]|nr:hypothetical protein [Acidobacteriota bacterium]
MKAFREFWRKLVDVRPGEYLRTFFMSMYLMCVLFAYYILKAVSRALFLDKFDIDKLPYLYVLIAAFGGMLAYFYSKLAARTSLKTAVTTATVFFISTFLVIRWLLGFQMAFTYYLFNIWVSLFSIVAVTQGWLVAANVFNAREAKRVYGLLGLGAVIGAGFGGQFAAWTVFIIGSNNLIVASSVMILLSYVVFRLAIAQPGVTLAGATGGEEEHFSLVDVLSDIRRYKHFQVIIGIIALTYVVDVLVEFQFSAMAKASYKGADLVRFTATFMGIYLNLVNFVFQFFLTGAVVRRFGVGGALQVMPVSIAIASIITYAQPRLLTTAATRLTEAATRYTFNRTGMELLYLPLPAELKNRTKAFVDIFADRFSRGLGGMLLVLLITVLGLPINQVPLVVLVLTICWSVLSWRAQREYVTTVRRRIESRRLDIETARINADDAVMIGLLEQTAAGPNARQTVYALGLLVEVEGYAILPLLRKLARAAEPTVRAKLYEIASRAGAADLLEQAMAEIRSSRAGDNAASIGPAVSYAITVSPESVNLAPRLLNHPNQHVAEAAMRCLLPNAALATRVITPEWLAEASASPDANRRRLAAMGVEARGADELPRLAALLADREPAVVEEALHSAGVIRSRTCLNAAVGLLADPHVRGAAIAALAQYGEMIAGTVSDLMEDSAMPENVRRQLPRVLGRIPSQRAVDMLMRSIGHPDLGVRDAVIRALNRLRERHPELDYGGAPVAERIHAEARYYFELHSAVKPFRTLTGSRSAANLLAYTLDQRLLVTLERLFRLLGLKYPPRQMHAAYLALARGKGDDHSAAIEFLDNLLDRELKRYLLPLLDDAGRMAERGLDLFGIPERNSQEAIRLLLRTGDSWLVSCAIATAQQLGLRGLAGEIRDLASSAGEEVSAVAESALAAWA